jgi:hypothetical protein
MFTGTTDNVPFNIRVNNKKVGRLDNNLASTLWGYQAGNAITTVQNNTANGHSALLVNTTGSSHTASGAGALRSNSNGANKFGIGFLALRNNQSGNDNTAIGSFALTDLNGGSNNISIGYLNGTDPGSPGVTNTISIGNNSILNAASNQAFLGNLSTLWKEGNKPWSTYSDARIRFFFLYFLL